MYNQGTIIVLVFGVGLAFAHNFNGLNFNGLEKQLKDKGIPDIQDIEKNLQENDLNFSNINNTKLNTEKVEQVIKEKCKKEGAESVIENLKDQEESLKDCLNQHINGSHIQDELEEAKKTGSMDEVFAKYCKKWPDISDCVENVTLSVRRCLNDKEEKAFNKTLDIINDLKEFMCFKDGDRLAMFVAEGGVECVQEQEQGIKNCVNSTIGGRFPNPEDISVATIPSFFFSEDDCNDFDTIRECIKVELEQCKDATPANIVDAFFKFLKKQMPCDTVAEKVGLKISTSPSTNSAYSTALTSNFIILELLFLVKVY